MLDANEKMMQKMKKTINLMKMNVPFGMDGSCVEPNELIE